MAGPAAVIAAGAVTVWLALATDDGLVADDYYKRGLAINQTLERDHLAVARRYRAQLALNPEGTAVRVTLRGGEGAVLPAALRLRLAHPTRAGLDQVATLQASGLGDYEGKLAPLQPGRWILVLEDTAATWRLMGWLQRPGSSESVLAAGAAAGNER